MKFMLEKKDLVEIVSSVARGAGVTPQTDGILIETINGQLKMTAHSFSFGVRLSTGEIEVKEEGSIVVKTNHFYDLVKKLPDSVITLEENNNKLTVRYGKSKANLNAISVDQFIGWPIKQTTELMQVPGKELKKGFGSTAFACAPNHFRQIFTGVYVDAKVSEKELVFVGSDTHRLAILKLPVEGYAGKDNFSFSVPVKNCAPRANPCVNFSRSPFFRTGLWCSLI
jgi:DNA polymerase-3 subunit beta